MEQELMRVGISLPENLLNKFDEIILQRGYSSRSEGVRDAIRSYIVNFEWMSDVQGERGCDYHCLRPFAKGPGR